MVSPIRLAIVDEHEIFRRGVQACLAEDPEIDIAVSTSSGPVSAPVDLAVVSATVAAQSSFDCPLVVCGRLPALSSGGGDHNRVFGTVPRNTLTTEQLLAAVHAAAVGLHVDGDPPAAGETKDFDERQQRVLRMLAEGADTIEIAECLRYSERTVKSLIKEVEQHLGARNRVQAVALGIRRGII
jgi:DNA-binding NarL/FixJ family response regulator